VTGGPEVRDHRWGPPISRAIREGEGSAAGGTSLCGRRQPGKAPLTHGPAEPAERPRPSVERGSGWLEEKKQWAAAGPKSERNCFRIKFGFLNIQRIWEFTQGDLGDLEK
jgi:hypothetical protein